MDERFDVADGWNPRWTLTPPPGAKMDAHEYRDTITSSLAHDYHVLLNVELPSGMAYVLRSARLFWNKWELSELSGDYLQFRHRGLVMFQGVSDTDLSSPANPYSGYFDPSRPANLLSLLAPIPIMAIANAQRTELYHHGYNEFDGPIVIGGGQRFVLAIKIAALGISETVGDLCGTIIGWKMPDPDKRYR